MQPDGRERSFADLLRDLSTETATLVRQEMQLARAEIAEKVKTIEISAVSFGGSAVFALGAFGTLTVCFVAALALILQLWAAALIVAVAYGAIASIFAYTGRRALAKAAPLLIPQTTQTVKDDITWAKTQVKSGTR